MKLFRKKENLFQKAIRRIKGFRKRKVKPFEVIILVLFFIFGFRVVKKMASKAAVSAYIGGPESAKVGEAFKVEVILVNESSRNKEIRVGGADLKVSEGLEVLSVSCGEEMPLAARAEVVGNTAFMTCFQQIGSSPLVVEPKKEILLGEIELQVKETEASSAQLDFIRLSIPQADSGVEMAKDARGKKFAF